MEQNFLIDEALHARKCARDAKKTFVLTNGCFDLLHAGHAYSLNQASLLGDTLWVAINSDDSVRALKGNDRPINCQKDRGYLLNSLPSKYPNIMNSTILLLILLRTDVEFLRDDLVIAGKLPVH